MPRTRSSRTSCSKSDRELRVQRGTRIIELLVVLRFRSSQTRVPHNDANFGIGPLVPSCLRIGHGRQVGRILHACQRPPCQNTIALIVDQRTGLGADAGNFHPCGRRLPRGRGQRHARGAVRAFRRFLPPADCLGQHLENRSAGGSGAQPEISSRASTTPDFISPTTTATRSERRPRCRSSMSSLIASAWPSRRRTTICR